MMLPPFEIAGGLPLALARGLSVAGMLSLFGITLAQAVVLPSALARLPPEQRSRLDGALNGLVWLSLLLAAFASSAWLWLVAGTLSDTPAAADVAATVPVLLAHTLFGHVLLIRLTLLLFAAGMAHLPVRWPAALLAGLATALQAAHGHALSMSGNEPSWLLLSSVLHLLAAGAWLGGLLPLLLAVRLAPPAAGWRACRRFSWLGGGCVVILAGTASYQFWILIEGLPGLIGTAYGLVALLKMVLFAVLLGFAAMNHFRLAPALSGAAPGRARRSLARSVGWETATGLLVVLAAGVLTSLPPSMHVQPVWPFPWRASLVTVREDAGFRREVIEAALALGLAALLLLAAMLIRNRVRWVAALAAAVIAWLAIPHFDLLFVQAYPTSYQHSPTHFATTAIMRGAALYPQHCAVCHGADGRGDGPAARTLAWPPADLTAAHLWDHGDGALFWWLSHGIDAPEGGLAMPGFAGVLSERQRWDLIDYIRARNAGLIYARSGTWSPPLHAPDLQAVCAGGRVVTLADLRGRILRLVIGGAPSAAEGPVTTIIASSDPALRPGAHLCVTRDESVPSAYAIVTGLVPGQVQGAQFLIDADGWLRAVQPADTKPGWDNPGDLEREVAEIRAHPIADAGDHTMHMPM